MKFKVKDATVVRIDAHREILVKQDPSTRGVTLFVSGGIAQQVNLTQKETTELVEALHEELSR